MFLTPCGHKITKFLLLIMATALRVCGYGIDERVRSHDNAFNPLWSENIAIHVLLWGVRVHHE